MAEPKKGVFSPYFNSEIKGEINVNDDFDVSARIQQLARERNLTVHSLAKVCGINPSTLAVGKKRGGEYSLDTIRRICNGLGLTLGEFCTPPNNSELRS